MNKSKGRTSILIFRMYDKQSLEPESRMPHNHEAGTYAGTDGICPVGMGLNFEEDNKENLSL